MTNQEFLRDLDKKLWTAADRLRSNLDAAVYKHAVLGLVLLKYVSDSFAQRLAAMNMAIRGIDFGKEWAGTFSREQHPDLKALIA